MGNLLRRILPVVVAWLLATSAGAQILISTNSTWSWRKGTSEASSPASAWREATFDDHLWSTAAAPFYYDNENVYRGNTQLPDMRNSYTTLFLRQRFTVADPAVVGALELKFFCDDGFVLWMNGVLVTNLNKAGAVAYNSTADRTVPEPLQWSGYTLPNPTYLRGGENVIAVQALNQPITSSDFIFTMELRAVLRDSVPPRILSVSPTAGAITNLQQVTVNFSEPVQGIGFSDLLVNGTSAVQMTGSGSVYTFTLPPLSEGDATITWDEGAKITDFGLSPNHFDHRAPTARWTYNLRDLTPPEVKSATPVAGSTMRQLSQIEIVFTEEVAGVDAGDLLANGVGASAVTGTGAGPYRFTFDPITSGTVNVTWRAQHGISDQAMGTNPFAAVPWSYVVDPNYQPPTIIINEVLTAYTSDTGLFDEDDELQDWIEIRNTSNTAFNLQGWSLTDNEDEPEKWSFPAITIPGGGYLVVFASGKDRREVVAGRRLHTNFKLSSSGEFVGLFSGESPRQKLSEVTLPEQRPNYSYGINASSQWRYYMQPTPGAANGSSAILGAVPEVKFSMKRGLFEHAFSLSLTNELEEAEIRFTSNGAEPTATTGNVYSGPINISSNAVIRAAAYLANHLPSITKTHTYIFPAIVAKQPANPVGFPATWIDTQNRSWTADYEMDPEIVNAPAYRDQITAALKSLPVISLVTKPQDMFDNGNGIYPKSQARGPSWERPASVEFIFHQEGRDVQANCGVQMQGNSVRDPVKTGKHSFRVVFKGDYGEEKLRERIFEDSPVEEFDTLTLRADFNNSWMHWDGGHRPRGQRVRDAFEKNLQRSMSGLSAHSRFFHLYVNGLYWGVYDPTERPDASFGVAYMGGKKADYDVVNEGQLVDGSMATYNAMVGLGALENNATFQQMQQYLDVPHYIDYVLLHFYVGHQDWGINKNWYTIRKRAPGEGFKYIAWDGELMMNELNFNRVTSSDTASGLHTKLVANPEYRMQFADRAHRHMFNGGTLTPEQAKVLYARWAGVVESAMVAESARWGDYRRDVHAYSSGPYVLFTRDDHFYAERSRLLNNYFPNRTAIVLGQLRAAGLYPNVNAPIFSRHGGRVENGHRLTVTGPSTIYYTTDGTDPREPFTGAINAIATPYTGQLTVTNDFVLKARSFSGGAWSALNEAVFTVDKLGVDVAITEIMYNPVGGSAYEYIELKNTGSVPLDLSGFSFEGISYIFPPSSVLPPGAVILLASDANPEGFHEVYPRVNVYGWFEDALNNGGERIALLDRDLRTVLSVTYKDGGGWPADADGGGGSLELVSESGDPNASGSWKTGPHFGGSPGTFANLSWHNTPVRLNEVYAENNSPFRPANQFPDWVELFNVSTNLDLSGWKLLDGSGQPPFVFPHGTLFSGGEYLIIYFDGQTNATGWHTPFGLEGNGESIILQDPKGNVIDVISYGPQVPGMSISRIEDGKWQLSHPTQGEPNITADVAGPGSLMINEWLANPLSGRSDWIELFNPGSKPAALEGAYFSTPSAVYRVRSLAFVPAGGYLQLHADEEGGADHLDFKLSAAGGYIALHDTTGNELQRITYIAQVEDVSEGRYPDGTFQVIQFPHTPSPGRANLLPPSTVTAPSLQLQLAPSAEPVLVITGQAGANYTLETSADLVSWVPAIQTNAPAGSFYIKVSLGEDQLFYRAKALN